MSKRPRSKWTRVPLESGGACLAPPLRIARRALAATQGYARRASPNECMGLLASSRDDRSGVVTAAVLLRAEATLARAVADPEGIAKAVARLRERQMILRGFWHSHVDFSAHHSMIDDATMTRLLPGMAEDNFVRPARPHLAPAVTASDEAVLPLANGTDLTVTLLGPAIPELGAHEKAHWSFVTTKFREHHVLPRAVQKGNVLCLSAGQVVLKLGVPEGATVSSQVVDRAPVRTATMYSLVVNLRGEIYVEALTVTDVDQRSFIQMNPCAIEIVGQPAAGHPPVENGRPEAAETVSG